MDLKKLELGRVVAAKYVLKDLETITAKCLE